MRRFHPWRRTCTRRLPCALLLVSLALVCSCKSAPKEDADQSTQMAMWLDSVPQLKALNVSNAEIAELNKAHEAGFSDPSSVVVIQLARQRKQPFADGQHVADLLNAGSSEETIVALARLSQLGPFSGEAQAMRLARLSDKILLAVARRRSQGLTVLSGGKLGELKNLGVRDTEMLEMIERGDSDETATKYIAARERAAGGHNFVYQTRARK